MKVSDIYSDFHCGRDAQHVNLVDSCLERSILADVQVHNNVPEKALTFGLVIGLGRKFFAV